MTTVTQKEPRNICAAATCDCVLPNVNIFENKDGYVLQAEMPGVNKDGLEVTLEGNELTIAGHRAEDAVKAELVYRESRPLDYRRTFELDPTIDATRIEAKIEQGVLTLRLPKQEKVKPRKIAVTE
jgi:HSP20 family protein